MIFTFSKANLSKRNAVFAIQPRSGRMSKSLIIPRKLVTDLKGLISSMTAINVTSNKQRTKFAMIGQLSQNAVYLVTRITIKIA